MKERYEIVNCDGTWSDLMDKHRKDEVEIFLATFTSGKYAVRLLRDIGFLVQLAYPAKLALIFNSAKKKDGEDS